MISLSFRLEPCHDDPIAKEATSAVAIVICMGTRRYQSVRLISSRFLEQRAGARFE